MQRQNALFLAGEYDKFVADVSRGAAHRAEALTPLDIVRLAYIERMRGDKETAWRLLADVENIDPAELPWTHRSLFTYQLVEMKLLDGDTEAAARLARTMLPRIRRSALSPTTGAFECADGVTRAFLAEAHRLARIGQRDAARALVKEAERALKQHAGAGAAAVRRAPAPRSRAWWRSRSAVATRAWRCSRAPRRSSRHGAVPCCAHAPARGSPRRAAAPDDPRRNAIFAEANDDVGRAQVHAAPLARALALPARRVAGSCLRKSRPRAHLPRVAQTVLAGSATIARFRPLPEPAAELAPRGRCTRALFAVARLIRKSGGRS